MPTEVNLRSPLGVLLSTPSLSELACRSLATATHPRHSAQSAPKRRLTYLHLTCVISLLISRPPSASKQHPTLMEPREPNLTTNTAIWPSTNSLPPPWPARAAPRRHQTSAPCRISTRYVNSHLRLHTQPISPRYRLTTWCL